MHCPECGFVNAEGANYCQKCGAFLGEAERARAATRPRSTRSTRPGSCSPVDLEEVTDEGATLVIRSGGGRAGEAFPSAGERMTIGRSPDAEVFLDDVTVSRNHALLVRRRDGLYIDDLGSLNGTYVNRRRIESHKLAERRRAAGRQVQAHLPGADERWSTEDAGAAGAAQGEGADDRRRLQAARARVPGHLDLEDPLPRGPEAARAAPHRRAATGSTRRPTSTGCARSCACSATSSCRCG